MCVCVVCDVCVCMCVMCACVYMCVCVLCILQRAQLDLWQPCLQFPGLIRVKRVLMFVTNSTFQFSKFSHCGHYSSHLHWGKNPFLAALIFVFKNLKKIRIVYRHKKWWIILEWDVQSLQCGLETKHLFCVKNPQRSCIWGFKFNIRNPNVDI